MNIEFPTTFDSSMLGTYKACPQKFFKEYILCYRPKGQSVHLHAGAAFARGIEVARRAFFCGEYPTYEPKSPNPDAVHYGTLMGEFFNAELAIAAGLKALLHKYGNFECPPDSAKSAERMAGAFEFYFTNYPLEVGNCEPVAFPNGKRAIEFTFAHPLPIAHPVTGDPILYVGSMDAILDYNGAGSFVTDEKTTTQLGQSWSRQWDLRSQFTGYCWGARESGIRVEGAIVRGVSILKTKYETQQAITYRPEWQIDRWYEQLLCTIEEIKTHFANIQAVGARHGLFPYNLDHACAEFGGCTYRQVCSSEDEKPWLETYFERRKWDPLTRKEILL